MYKGNIRTCILTACSIKKNSGQMSCHCHSFFYYSDDRIYYLEFLFALLFCSRKKCVKTLPERVIALIFITCYEIYLCFWHSINRIIKSSLQKNGYIARMIYLFKISIVLFQKPSFQNNMHENEVRQHKAYYVLHSDCGTSLKVKT